MAKGWKAEMVRAGARTGAADRALCLGQCGHVCLNLLVREAVWHPAVFEKHLRGAEESRGV